VLIELTDRIGIGAEQREVSIDGLEFQYQVPPTVSPASSTRTFSPNLSRSDFSMCMPEKPAPITTASKF
jgi:hypothetical protein